MVSLCCRKHADFSTGVDQVTLARDAVNDEKKVTVISQSTGSHQASEEDFLQLLSASCSMHLSSWKGFWLPSGLKREQLLHPLRLCEGSV